MRKEMWMEDVNGICADACKFIQGRLAEFRIRLSDEKEDSLFDAIQDILELEGAGEYKGYN